jgi:hypothetical protein
VLDELIYVYIIIFMSSSEKSLSFPFFRESNKHHALTFYVMLVTTYSRNHSYFCLCNMFIFVPYISTQATFTYWRHKCTFWDHHVSLCIAWTVQPAGLLSQNVVGNTKLYPNKSCNFQFCIISNKNMAGSRICEVEKYTVALACGWWNDAW